MTDHVIFGGTVEGRRLSEILSGKGRRLVVCVATEYGEELIKENGSVTVKCGRLDAGQMTSLVRECSPLSVIDATHPYAIEVSANIRKACEETGVKYLRLVRENVTEGDILEFASLEDAIEYLNSEKGVIFSTLGTKEALMLTRVCGYEERVWLRILPSADGIRQCVELGFPSKHLICMQGPFSEKINEAMFSEAKADILLTKQSGAAGGYPEKLAAAHALGMKCVAIRRPEDIKNGYTFDDMLSLLLDGEK